MQKLVYLKEIENAEWVHEVIAETFDNALELISEESIVYGGAVRDCLAGRKLEGDLDILVPYQDMGLVVQTFSSNPKWVDIKNDHSKAYQSISQISGISVFRNMNDKTVQLIRTQPYPSAEKSVGLLRVAGIVDIVCCGVVMTKNGTVYEVVPNAYKECIEGVLTINRSSEIASKETLSDRINKLVDRGWKSEIDINRAIKKTKHTKQQQQPKKKNFGTATFRSKSVLQNGATIKSMPHNRDTESVYEFRYSGKGDFISGDFVRRFDQIEDTKRFLTITEDFARRHRLDIKVRVKYLSINVYSKSSGALKALGDSLELLEAENNGMLQGQTAYERVKSGMITTDVYKIPSSQPDSRKLRWIENEEPIPYSLPKNTWAEFRNFNDPSLNKQTINHMTTEGEEQNNESS